MLHTVLSGPPGAGKSHVGVILAKLWTALGFLKSSNTSNPIPIKSTNTNTSDPKLKELDVYVKSLISSGRFKNTVIRKLQEHLLLYRQQIEEEAKATHLDLYKLKTMKSDIEKLLVNDFRLMKIFNVSSELISNAEKRKLYYKTLNENIIPEETIGFAVLVEKGTKQELEDTDEENNEDTNNEDTNIEDTNKDDTNKDNKDNINKEENNKYKELDDIINSIKAGVIIPPQPPLPPPPTLKIMGETDLEPKKFDLIRIVSREDFIGGYMGQSAIKTEKLLRDSIGKVLFIDEAYSLVNDEKDSYGIEALSTLNRFMSEHAKEIIIIFAGYKDKLETTIFKYQPGLKRRCTWNFEIDPYTEVGLAHIFKEQLRKTDWLISEDIDLVKFFKDNKEDFPFFGGDTLRLAFSCKICYSSEIFDYNLNNDRVITKKILDKALTSFKLSKMREEKENMSYKMLYT